MEAADAASVARLVRGVLVIVLLEMCGCCVTVVAMCVCGGDGVTRRVRVLERCEVPRCAKVSSIVCGPSVCVCVCQRISS